MPLGTLLCAQWPIASRIMAWTTLLLMTSKGSFLFVKKKFTAEHTASIHKIIYGTDNWIPVTWWRLGSEGKEPNHNFERDP